MLNKIKDFFKTKVEPKIKKHKHYWIQYGGYYFDSWWGCKICQISKVEFEMNTK